MYIAGIHPHTTLIAKTQSIKFIIQNFKVSVPRNMKRVLKDELDARQIGGTDFVQANLTFSKLDEIITHNKVTTNQNTGEREEHLLHIGDDVVSSEDEIMTALEE